MNNNYQIKLGDEVVNLTNRWCDGYYIVNSTCNTSSKNHHAINIKGIVIEIGFSHYKNKSVYLIECFNNKG